MARLLYVEASPRKERSASIEVAKAFVEEYRKTHPGDEVDALDLWATPLPEFDGEVINAKYAILHGQEHTPEQKDAWKAVEGVIARFKGADKYLFSLPMWNFGIPYKLKHFIDVLVQPTYTFSFSPKEGYKGLVTGKKVAVVYARGGAYPAGSGGEAFDLQKKYMELLLGFIGFTDITPIVVEPTLAKPESVARTKGEAAERARSVAGAF
ncbi:MAG TPA: FMN-dependent NADH-azoreductase [Deltaproteobacteria bacterium]|nr:MAG: FMN-dependent NADH-azoreductase [Deltaproteobacteria bacterium GWB2_65_81]OGP40514.1 MAG: FMN-dependent NADH-azoreductase [Deltaproteobacteria bacterium GWC2_66_88]HAM33831.1 FMN-dependent NADH-azoreductase [Deltaproteobacteria bacterium]HBG73820.1 FMN-dependent NADH-azoreductase [Deltaproteobacteria bacterium]